MNISREVAAEVPDMVALDTYARECWEMLLLFLLGASGPPPMPALISAKPLDLRKLMIGAK